MIRGGGSIAKRLAYLLQDPDVWGFISSAPKKLLRKNLLMLLRFINIAAFRKVDYGLKMQLTGGKLALQKILIILIQ